MHVTKIREFVLQALIGPVINLDFAAGELSDEVDGAGAGLADDVNERSVGVELYLTWLRGEG